MRFMTTWKIDPAHTTLEFSARHMMITTVKGRFSELEGTVTMDDADPSRSVAEVTIQAASIDTRTEQRDQHLRSGDFLDVESHPAITFRSTRIQGNPVSPGDSFTLEGDLTIRGTSKPVTLEATYEGEGKDPWGGTRRSFGAKGKIDRREFGLTWNQALEAGGVLVSNEIKMEIDLQLVKEG
jgi:polyisoprenoid-binding protein YceI